MAALTLPATGACRCGKTRFQITAVPMFTAVCHCRGCHQMTGGYSSLTASVLEDQFDLLEGSPIQGGLMNPDLQHMHCDRCLTWLYTQGAWLQGRLNVRASQFDDPSWFVPILDCWMSEALPGDVAATEHVYDGWPDRSDLPMLAAKLSERLKVSS